jgi:hypothetical protein
LISAEEVKQKLRYSSAEIIPAFKRAEQTEIVRTLTECGDVVRIAYCMSCGAKHYSGHNRCRNRYCPVCSKLRALLWIARLLPLLDHWFAGGGYVFSLNLTIKDTDALQNGIDTLFGAWRVLYHDDRKSRKEFKERFAGGVRSLEVKQGKNSGQWHPHFHALVLRRGFGKDYEYLRAAWEKAVTAADGEPDKGGSVWLHSCKRDDLSLHDAVVEVFKYMTKYDWHNAQPDKINEMVKTLHGRKGIQTWGVLYGLADRVEDEFENSEYEELRGYVCRVCGFSEFEFDNIVKSDFLADTNIGDLLKIKEH